MGSMRITGLASGMDTDSIITELMNASKAPLNKLNKNKTTIEWQREALLDTNSKMLEFQNIAFDMRLQSVYQIYNADVSDRTAFSATASAEAIEGTYRVFAEQLATTTKFQGIEVSKNIESSKLRAKKLDLRGKEFYINVDGIKKKIVLSNDESNNFSDIGEGKTYETMEKAMRQLEETLNKEISNKFGAEQVNVKVTGETGEYYVNISSANALNLPISITSADEEEKDALSALRLDSGDSNVFDTGMSLKDFLGRKATFDADGKMTMTVNGKTFEFDEDQSLSDVFKTISNDEELDIQMKYDKISKTVIMERKSSGAGRTIEVSDTAGLCSAFGLTKDGTGGTYKVGQNAKVDITDPNGRKIEDVQFTSNNFTFQGVTFTALEENKEASVTVAKDVDAIFDKIVKFADSFNNVLGTLNTLYNEEKTGYEPLTDEERDSLSETQEEKWEKMAKQGILRRDSTLQSAISQMRQAVVSSINTDEGQRSLFEIGISTTAYDATNSSNNGKLVIDEDKLKQAITNDLDKVISIFTSSPSNIQGNVLDTSKTLNLNGKSMDVTYAGVTKTITFNRDYDLSLAEDKKEFENYVNGQLESYFGAGKLSASISSGRFIINSLKKVDTSVSAVEGNDALELLGIQGSAKYDTSQRGFGTKMYDIMASAMSSITEKAGNSATSVDDSTLGQKIKRINSDISKLQTRLEEMEDRYYTQFAAMEQAISNMNSQSSYIYSMLGNNG